MTNKKLEAKRLAIFLFLAFALTWIPAWVLNAVFGYDRWFEGDDIPFFCLIFGYGPALANVITRKLTHEGWHDSMLHLRLKGNLKYYIFAVLIMTVVYIPEGIMITLIHGHGDFSDIGSGMNWKEITASILLILITSPAMAFNTFGEEFGWRGYMNQKMEPLIGTAGTVIVGGIIWGVWHAELTVKGHNFGTDYPGFPYMGILMMCFICTFEGMILMWVTKKTGSIYPACIIHAMNNNGGTSIAYLLVSGVPEDFKQSIPQSMLSSIPSCIICTGFLVLMLIEKRKNRAETKSLIQA